MPNLNLLLKLHKKYNKESDLLTQNKSLVKLNEAINSKTSANVIKNMGGDYKLYFEEGKEAPLTSLFIDICHFSTKYESYTNSELVEFLDEYYNIVIPLIYEFEGEVDKIMGDGIICIFAPPFSENSAIKNFKKALCCSSEIIKATNNTKFESKVALHSGRVRYYKNSSVYYSEYTIIGKAITELFRLESISLDSTINFFCNSDSHKYLIKILKATTTVKQQQLDKQFKLNRNRIEPTLKGVNYGSFYSISKRD